MPVDDRVCRRLFVCRETALPGDAALVEVEDQAGVGPGDIAFGVRGYGSGVPAADQDRDSALADIAISNTCHDSETFARASGDPLKARPLHPESPRGPGELGEGKLYGHIKSRKTRAR
jgi:hypothetical protein